MNTSEQIFLDTYQQSIDNNQKRDSDFLVWITSLQQDFISLGVAYCDAWIAYIQDSSLSLGKKKTIIAKLQLLRKKYLSISKMSLVQFELGLQMMNFEKNPSIVRDIANIPLSPKSSLNREEKRQYFGLFSRLLCSRKYNPIGNILTLEDEVSSILASSQKVIQHKNTSSEDEGGIAESNPKPREPSGRFVSIDIIQKLQHNSETPAQKMGQIQARLDNILSGPFTEKHLQELGVMRQRVEGMRVETRQEKLRMETLNRIDSAMNGIRENISSPTTQVPVIEGESNFSQKDTDNSVEILPQNKEWKKYIQELLSDGLDYTLSSTKKNKNFTVGDGSFVVKVLRPFLQSLIALLDTDRIDASSSSWKEIIAALDMLHDDADVARIAFRGILAKSSVGGSWQDLWQGLITAIEIYSNHAEFREQRNAGKMPLSNVIEFMQNNPPPTR